MARTGQTVCSQAPTPARTEKAETEARLLVMKRMRTVNRFEYEAGLTVSFSGGRLRLRCYMFRSKNAQRGREQLRRKPQPDAPDLCGWALKHLAPSCTDVRVRESGLEFRFIRARQGRLCQC